MMVMVTPEPKLEKVEATATEVIRETLVAQDFIVLRLAVAGLIVAIMMGLAGLIYLTAVDKEMPEGIIAIASAAVGALSTMLVRNAAER